MATYLENLKTARDQIAANLVTITASPKPSYSIDGEQYSWNELFQAYTQQLEALESRIAANDVGEVESFGIDC